MRGIVQKNAANVASIIAPLAGCVAMAVTATILVTQNHKPKDRTNEKLTVLRHC